MARHCYRLRCQPSRTRGLRLDLGSSRLHRRRHFAPRTTEITAEGWVDLSIVHVFRPHGPPNSIASDRGPQFASHFWAHLCHCLEIQRRLSTAFYPETRIDAAMEEYLRGFVNSLQEDWAIHLLPSSRVTTKRRRPLAPLLSTPITVEDVRLASSWASGLTTLTRREPKW